MGDAGLTGRKIIIDTYGGMARHGGGAFSGKDPSKVDRSAAYAMRWVAKNIVAAGLATRCEVQVAYAIGKAHPVGFFVECFGTETVPVARIQDAVTAVFDLRPAAIIRDLDLLRPIYAETAAYGHFGRELPNFTWERTNRVDELRAAVEEAASNLKPVRVGGAVRRLADVHRPVPGPERVGLLALVEQDVAPHQPSVAGLTRQDGELVRTHPLEELGGREDVFVGHGAGEGTTLARRAWGCVGDRRRRRLRPCGGSWSPAF